MEPIALTPTEQFYNIARQAKQFGDPQPRITAAQWALTSDWGKRSTGNNNFWALHAYPAQPSTNTQNTLQYLDFDSVEDALTTRLERFKARRYAAYWTAQTPEEAARALQQADYPNDLTYTERILQIMTRMYGASNTSNTSNTQSTPNARVALKKPALPVIPTVTVVATTPIRTTSTTNPLAWPEGLRPSIASPRVISGRTHFDGKGVTARTQNGLWWVDARGRIFHAQPGSEEASEAYLPWYTAEKNILGLEPEESQEGVRIIGAMGTFTLIPDHPTRYGYEGYVRVRLGEETETLPEGANFRLLASEIAPWLGTPYRAGGTTKSGCDAASFVGAVYRKLGITLPRTSSAIAFMPSRIQESSPTGTNNAISELRFGDVLCYPGHVAIYLGNGQTVEAMEMPDNNGKVQKNHIWIQEEITVKRFLP
jgi:hypothetical protein